MGITVWSNSHSQTLQSSSRCLRQSAYNFLRRCLQRTNWATVKSQKHPEGRYSLAVCVTVEEVNAAICELPCTVHVNLLHLLKSKNSGHVTYREALFIGCFCNAQIGRVRRVEWGHMWTLMYCTCTCPSPVTSRAERHYSLAVCATVEEVNATIC